MSFLKVAICACRLRADIFGSWRKHQDLRERGTDRGGSTIIVGFREGGGKGALFEFDIRGGGFSLGMVLL